MNWPDPFNHMITLDPTSAPDQKNINLPPDKILFGDDGFFTIYNFIVVLAFLHIKGSVVPLTKDLCASMRRYRP